MGVPSRRQPARRTRHHVKITRDLVLFVGGLAGVTHETLFAHSDRPELLLVFAGMMGLPMFFQGDSNLRDWRLSRRDESPSGGKGEA